MFSCPAAHEVTMLVASMLPLRLNSQLLTTCDNFLQLFTTRELVTTCDNLWEFVTICDNLQQLVTTFHNFS